MRKRSIDVKQTQAKWVHRTEAHLETYQVPMMKFFWRKYFTKSSTINVWQGLNPFLLNVLFWFPWKHQKTKGFLMFSVESKGNFGKDRVKYAFIECAQQNNTVIKIKTYWNLWHFSTASIYHKLNVIWILIENLYRVSFPNDMELRGKVNSLS